MTPVATYHCPLGGKFGVPRQSGVVPELKGTIVLEPEFRDANALRGLEEFDYLWLLWSFDANRDEKWRPTVRPPRLGGNARIGVFATRSPYHPNAIGLSSVKIESIDAANFTIYVSGADLMDGTPILDIKPYITYTDSHPCARSGFVDNTDWNCLEVEFACETEQKISAEELSALSGILSQDPRPHYQDSPEKVYGMNFGRYDVKFKVSGNILTVISLDEPHPGTSE